MQRDTLASAPVAGDLAICHTQIGDYAGTHCGIFFSKDDQVKVLHLALHLFLCEQPATAPYGFVSTGLEKTLRRSVSKLCRLIIAKHGNRVPYGFEFGAVINEDGTFPSPTPGDGFTCTTFVLAIFNVFKITLVDVSTWPVGVNTGWQHEVIQLIINNAEHRSLDVAEHVAALQKQSNAIRVTPQELAAAVCTGKKTFPELSPDAQAIVAYLRASFPALTG